MAGIRFGILSVILQVIGYLKSCILTFDVSGRVSNILKDLSVIRVFLHGFLDSNVSLSLVNYYRISIVIK